MDNNSTAATPVNLAGVDPSFPGLAVDATIVAPLPLPVTETPAFPTKQQALGGATPTEEAVISAAPCELRTLTGYNSDSDTTAELFVQLHDAAAVPLASGAVPRVIIPVKGRQTFSLSQDIAFATGLVLALSTTEFTFTAAAPLMLYQATFGIAA